MAGYKAPDKIGESLLLDGFSDLSCQALRVCDVVEADEGGGKRHP